jgi:hypothetical protein
VSASLSTSTTLRVPFVNSQAPLSSRRVWLMLGEWSSVPRDLQPDLAEFLVRCVLPLQRFTVKVAAIEQQASSGLRSTERRWDLSSAQT